ncbi:hypothetical protein [Streptomyces sp. 8K308]|uniref:hypothetical protein n=1 Tax=Streptomyces sp. 8K308 TaxID=2530388 RepID=UPI001FB5CEB8|nr:hypothetical protein [Streptomyces sp. 8K308]
MFAVAWWSGPGRQVADGDEPPLARVERFVADYVRRIGAEPRFRELLEVVALRTEPLPELATAPREKQQTVEAWRAALVPVLAADEAAGQPRPGRAGRGGGRRRGAAPHHGWSEP